MTQRNTATRPLHPVSWGRRMLLGGGIALALIVLFLLPVGDGKPEWGKFWMIRPLIVVPVAGAVGGLLYYIMDGLRSQGSWKWLLANVISLLGYVFALWIGTVLGLDGTLWN